MKAVIGQPSHDARVTRDLTCRGAANRDNNVAQRSEHRSWGKYGYAGTDRVLQLVAENENLRANLSAAAHLIHGSTEGRFRVTYCPGRLTQEQIESVNFRYTDLGKMMAKYDPKKLKDGFNAVDGETIFYISNPALGLWSTRTRFL